MITERTQITEAGFSARTLAVIRRAFPSDIATLGELKQAMTDNPLCKNLGKKTIGEIEAVLAETDTETDSTAVSETVETDAPTETETAFDYSLVDEDTAQYLRKATAKIANSYADIGAVLAEAQERLAHNNNGVFEKWYTSVGISKRSLYRLIDIYNFRNQLIKSCQIGTISGNELEIFDNLPKMLQSDISSPSAPAEAVNAVLSGDITTHKDFVAMKKRIEELEKKLEDERDSAIELEEERDRLFRQCKEAEANARTISASYDKLSKLNQEHFDDLKKEREKSGNLEEERDKLLAENRKLRKQPKETVTIEKDPTESKEYKALNKMNDDLIEENQELRDERDGFENECDDLREEIEDLKGQLKSSRTVTVPTGLDHEHLREFFESLYGRAGDAMRDCVQFLKDDYPAETKKYVEQRIYNLKSYFETLIDNHFGKEEEPWL